MISDIQEKRAKVIEYYQKCYRTKFRRSLSDQEVEMLYGKMIQLKWSVENHIADGGHHTRRLKEIVFVEPCTQVPKSTGGTLSLVPPSTSA